MNCAYHGQNVAVVNCNGCGKPLCPSCDHRIKGFPYCQDCIVSGVELLRNYNQSSYAPIIKRQTSPVVAAILSFICPGLGAAYNGQTTKALVYFAIFVGLFQMAVLTGGMPLFVLGFIGMWLFAALDSYRTANLLRSGVVPNGAEDLIVQRFAGNPKLWGIVLTALGATFFINAFFNIRFLMRGILPVLLIGFGIYLLRDYVFKSKKTERNWSDYETQTPAPMFVSAVADANFRRDEFDQQNDYETGTRVPGVEKSGVNLYDGKTTVFNVCKRLNAFRRLNHKQQGFEKVMSILYKAAGLGSILALLALIVTFLKQIIALVAQLLALISFLMFAVKILIVIAFIGLIAGVGFLIFRSWKANRQAQI